jgi:hypothetical protein
MLDLRHDRSGAERLPLARSVQDEPHSPAPDEPQLDDERLDEPQSEAELRARLEEELKRITVRNILVQTVVTLVNLGGQRLGASEATRDVRDLGQTRMAIEAVRGLLPLLETSDEDAEQMRPVRDALAQLQIAYAREVGAPPADRGETGTGTEPGAAEPPGQAQQPPEQPSKPSGRLWVPPGSAG